MMSKFDHSMSMGLDHRRVHVYLAILHGKRAKNGRNAFHFRGQPQLGCEFGGAALCGTSVEPAYMIVNVGMMWVSQCKC